MRASWLFVIALLLCIGCGGGSGTAPDNDKTTIDGLFQRRNAFLNGQRLGDTDYQLEMSVEILGNASEVEWNFGGGASPNTSDSPTVVIQLGAPGNYAGHVVIRDVEGLSHTKPFRYRVAPLTEPLITSVSPVGYVGLTGVPVFLRCVLSYPVADVNWFVEGSPLPDGARPDVLEFTSDRNGTHDIRVEVESVEGDRESREWKIKTGDTTWERVGSTNTVNLPFTATPRQLSDGRAVMMTQHSLQFFGPTRADLVPPGSVDYQPFSMLPGLETRAGDVALVDGRLVVVVAVSAESLTGKGLWLGITENVELTESTQWQTQFLSIPDFYARVRLLVLPNNGLLIVGAHTSRQRISAAWGGLPEGPEDWTDLLMPSSIRVRMEQAALIDNCLVLAERTEVGAEVATAPLEVLEQWGDWTTFELTAGSPNHFPLEWDTVLASTNDSMAFLMYTNERLPQLFLSPQEDPEIRGNWAAGITVGNSTALLDGALAIGLTDSRVIAVVPGKKPDPALPSFVNNSMEVWTISRADQTDCHLLDAVRFKAWTRASVVPMDTVTIVGHGTGIPDATTHTNWLVAPPDVWPGNDR